MLLLIDEGNKFGRDQWFCLQFINQCTSQTFKISFE